MLNTPRGSDSPPSLVSTPPRAQLVNAFAEPYNNAVATARTCYSARVVWPADVDRDEQSRTQRDVIAASTYAAGHHTTLQHATFQFVLQNVSRQLIWSFLHSHPFYNSEQVSQRYVAVLPDRVLVPLLPPPALALYRNTVAAQMAAYRALITILHQPLATEYFKIFPARRKRPDEARRTVRKRAQELARYVLPVATHAHLYHTISALTLHRYHRLCQMLDVPEETRLLVQAMVTEVERHDPLFVTQLEDPIPLEDTHEYAALEHMRAVKVSESARAFRSAFDNELTGRRSRLLASTSSGESLLARTVRSVLGVPQPMLDDDAAVAMVLDPGKSPYLGGALNLTAHGKLTRAMVHVHYTFQKKLSHSADSQDQRHRATPGTRPVLYTHYVGGEPDVIVPDFIAQHPAALERFMDTMTVTFVAIDRLLDQGVAAEQALYLLPNAFPIRFEESGDLMGWRHKWVTRLCYNAQEEIWRAAVDEVEQVRQCHPHIGSYLGPPCALRHEAGVKPYCPEGSRYCGVPVWRLLLQDYRR